MREGRRKICPFSKKGLYKSETMGYNAIRPGRLAQLGERCVRIAEVEGSIPFESTKRIPHEGAAG